MSPRNRSILQVWQLNSSLLLRTAGGRPMDNIVYTFDFFDPWDYVTSDDEHGYTYPGSYPCNVAYRGWVPLFCPGGYAGAESEVRIDKVWLHQLLLSNPIALSAEHNVPVLCNQYGVKRSVSEARGRLRYAIHSAL